MPRSFSKYASHVAALTAVTGGFSLWMLSPILTGDTEPWDAHNQLLYLAALAGLGAACGLIAPERFWAWPAGIYAGQLIAILYRRHQLPPGGADFLIPLGLLFLVPYTVPSLVGSALGVVGASLLSRRGQAER
jgi:hypothetical protein